MVKRLHKTLHLAKKERDKANRENILGGNSVYRVKGASVWKFYVGTHLEWLNR